MTNFPWNKFFFICVLLIGSTSLKSQVNEQNLKFKEVFTEEELLEIDKIDSINHLSISILKKPGKIYSIKLKHPKLLKSISIHHPDSYIFLDSLPNVNQIGIEGKFYGVLKIKLNPLNIDTFIVYNIKSTNYEFLEQFKNLQCLDIGFYNKPDKLFEIMSKIKSLKDVSFHSHKREVKLPSYIKKITSLEKLGGNVKFATNNLRLLMEMKNLKEITFTLINIKNVPKEYFELKEKKKVSFKHCKGNLPG